MAHSDNCKPCSWDQIQTQQPHTHLNCYNSLNTSVNPACTSIIIITIINQDYLPSWLLNKLQKLYYRELLQQQDSCGQWKQQS